jgi:RNA polymerase sigma factor (sigma-70 family)
VTLTPLFCPRPNLFAPCRLSSSQDVEAATHIVGLARRATAGEGAAREELLQELRPVVVRAVRLVVGSGSPIAEDAAQEAMIDISRGIANLRDPQAVKAWALQVATRRAIRVSRGERLRSLSSRSGKQLEPEPGMTPDEGRHRAIKQCFDLLPPRLRATAVLRLYVGLSEFETAEVLGCSIGTVKSNLHDARKRLSDALEERGITPNSP